MGIGGRVAFNGATLKSSFNHMPIPHGKLLFLSKLADTRYSEKKWRLCSRSCGTTKMIVLSMDITVNSGLIRTWISVYNSNNKDTREIQAFKTTEQQQDICIVPDYWNYT